MKSYKLEQDYVGGVGYDAVSQAWYWLDRRGWDAEPSVAQKKSSTTYGAVVRPLRWQSLSYYESSTFTVIETPRAASATLSFEF